MDKYRYLMAKYCKGCEGKGCEGKGCEGKGCEGKGCEGKGCEGKGCEGKFIGATIFYIRGDKMGEVVEFVRVNNYRGYLMNNMYDSNRIVVDRSHVHFLERLFGVL